MRLQRASALLAAYRVVGGLGGASGYVFGDLRHEGVVGEPCGFVAGFGGQLFEFPCVSLLLGHLVLVDDLEAVVEFLGGSGDDHVVGCAAFAGVLGVFLDHVGFRAGDDGLRRGFDELSVSHR